MLDGDSSYTQHFIALCTVHRYTLRYSYMHCHTTMSTTSCELADSPSTVAKFYMDTIIDKLERITFLAGGK